MALPAVTQVAVAVIVNQQGQVLISKRPDHVHQGGRWEFPGGKLEVAECVEQALARELEEELDITPLDYRPLIRIRHAYPGRPVLLDVWIVDAFAGVPHGRENQPLAWKAVDELDVDSFPAANAGILKAIRLPSTHLITGRFDHVGDFEQRLSAALENGIRLVQLRLQQEWLAANGRKLAHELVAVSRAMCRRFGARLMFNLPASIAGEIAPGADEGIHLTSRGLMRCTGRPSAALVSASCHDEYELARAEKLELDFALLSPVLETASHPGATVLGWDRFRALSDAVSLPLFALGGMSKADLEHAWRCGAQGIAAIGAFWEAGRTGGA